MLRSKKVWSSLVVAFLIAGGLWLSASPATGAGKVKGVTCVIDMLVETTGSAGGVSSVPYHNEFVLQDGEAISDDFSTATRLKFFDAELNKVGGEWVMSMDWFVDSTVFNSVDFSTSVSLAKGQKVGKSIGTHTFFTSGASTTTHFSIVCTEN